MLSEAETSPIMREPQATKPRESRGEQYKAIPRVPRNDEMDSERRKNKAIKKMARQRKEIG